MIIAAVVSGIFLLIFAPTLYFMITRRSKSTDHDAFQANINDNNDQTTNNPSYQNNSPEIISGHDRNPESNVTIEIIPESKNPRDHFK